MSRDARSARIGQQILLIAMAIQGLTPDFRSLSSPWLLRILTWELAEYASGKDSGSLPAEDHNKDSDEVFAPGGMHANLRPHRDAAGRPTADLTPISTIERSFRSRVLAFHPHIIAKQWDDDLIRSLCRFLC